MSATDELRRMLTEAGVEWDYGITGAASTMFNANGVELTFIDMRDGVTCSTILTPAQAIAATVGASERTTTRHGKCKTKYGRKVPLCECCGYSIGDGRWHYCPSCGAKVVDE